MRSGRQRNLAEVIMDIECKDEEIANVFKNFIALEKDIVLSDQELTKVLLRVIEIAAWVGNCNVVEWMCNRWNKLDYEFRNKCSVYQLTYAFAMATVSGYEKILEALLAQIKQNQRKGINLKFDINAPCVKNMKTPLMIAATEGFLDIVIFLLRNGAAWDIKHLDTGKTALDYAKECNHVEIVNYLEKYKTGNPVKMLLDILQKQLEVLESQQQKDDKQVVVQNKTQSNSILPSSFIDPVRAAAMQARISASLLRVSAMNNKAEKSKVEEEHSSCKRSF
jgi:hypothetical protein